MTPEELDLLMDKYLHETLTREEFEQLWSTLQAAQYQERWQAFIDEAMSRDYAALSDRETEARIMQNILPGKTRLMTGWRWAAAAALIILAGTFLWTALPQKQAPPPPVADAAPGRNGAILVLADGTQMTLDSLENGTIAQQQGTSIALKDGSLTYTPAGHNTGASIYNTVITPKGRQFQLTLPDGSRAWLNAASSIRYPVAFRGKERKVIIDGEVYFEIAKHASMPFVVDANGKTAIEVLGTDFNVSAYANEQDITTTLLEGSVRVNASLTLERGQQAIVSANHTRLVQNADIEKIMAWKNGLFNFDGASLQAVMRQLERWYDIEVTYEGHVPDIRFRGEMSRNIPLSTLLEMLKKMKLHFRMEGERKLVVIP